MRPAENYTRHVLTAFGLTLALMASFQVYIFREPARIAADEARDKLIAVTLGRGLYEENCAMCHGKEGEGVDGPPLNDINLLTSASDETIFSLISSGVPGTEMPAWGQVHGGPFTDQEVGQIVAFVREWEEGAPDRQAMAMKGDPVNGLLIFKDTCTICHGQDGSGTERAPALNDLDKLSQFDDEWYRETITKGRPAQGMPTWGTVLSPIETRDLIALLRAWERGQEVHLPGPAEEIQEAVHMFGHGDMHAAEHFLQRAADGAEGHLLEVINEALKALESEDWDAVEEALEAAGDHMGVEGGGHDH